MKIALISTVFNEGDDIFAWAKSLQAQTRRPDEFVIVDGGSTDGTPEQLRKAFCHGDFPVPRVIVEKCNIARGRNLAIQNVTADIIAVTDAGSFPEKEWLNEIARPLLEDLDCDVTGGLNISEQKNSFQIFLTMFEEQEVSGKVNGDLHPSSRNTAFRRKTWSDVGGYPEWLTLAAEDSLFTHELNKVGKKFIFNPQARVHWAVRPTARAFFQLNYRNAFGSAEARLNTSYFLRRVLLTLFPPLLLLSKHRHRHFKFRYFKNASSACGWLAGIFQGHKPPVGWRRIKGILLSPEAQKFTNLS